MGRRTRSTMPLSEDVLQPEATDPVTVSSEINRRKQAYKAHYDKHAQASLQPLPLGSHTYAKPRPSQRGSPWINGQIIKNPTPRSYSIDTGNLVLRRNRTQLRPPAPPINVPMQLPPPPLAQTSAPVTAEYTTGQQLSAMPLQAERPDSVPPAEPQQADEEFGGTSAVPSRQPTTRSGRVAHQPKKFKDFVLY